MLNVGVFFGSRAAEHDVSIISGLQILENADKAKYNAFPVYVSRKGEWFVGEPLKKIETYKPFDENMKRIDKGISAACAEYGRALRNGRQRNIRQGKAALSDGLRYTGLSRHERRGRHDPGAYGTCRHAILKLRRFGKRRRHG